MYTNCFETWVASMNIVLLFNMVNELLRDIILAKETQSRFYALVKWMRRNGSCVFHTLKEPNKMRITNDKNHILAYT
jgi:hypothetical protein